MAARAVFYQLTHKYVNTDKDIPEDAQQVIYYSLAIGHHVGVLDCFQSLMEIPLEDYRNWIAQMPAGKGRHKLEGLLNWGEIEINRSHAGELVPVLRNLFRVWMPPGLTAPLFCSIVCKNGCRTCTLFDG